MGGNFLGMVTLERNRPILYDDLDIKSLLHEAFHKGKEAIDTVVQFVCELISHVKDSIIFKIPNAWTEGILSILDEIRRLTNTDRIYLNANFAIETLFQKLAIGADKYKDSE